MQRVRAAGLIAGGCARGSRDCAIGSGYNHGVQPGVVIDRRFQLIEKLGGGSFGVVWRALDPASQREVAIKFLRSDRAAAPRARERFEREAQILLALAHPGIVRALAWGEQDGLPYIVLELA